MRRSDVDCHRRRNAWVFDLLPPPAHILRIMHSSFYGLLAQFLVYSFIGWVIESAYKTIRRRQGFVNSGLLYGPVVPIYGCGALCIMLFDDATRGLVFPARILALTLICAALEYLVGWFFESVFKTRLWDYTQKRFNIKGRVCLSFTLAWAALALLFIYVVRPVSESLVGLFLGEPWARACVAALASLFVADAALSFRSLALTSSAIGKLRENARLCIEGLDVLALKDSVRGVGRRLFRAFPHLEKLGAEGFSLDLSRLSRELSIEGGYFAKALQALRDRPENPEGLDPEYLGHVGDLLAEGEARKGDSSRRLTVSLASFYLAKALGLDERSTARAALLQGYTARSSRAALERFHARFALNPIEDDIILSRGWPASKPFHAYKESLLVSSVDRLASVKDRRSKSRV